MISPNAGSPASAPQAHLHTNLSINFSSTDTIPEMQAAILKYVAGHPGTTFIEIMRVVGEPGRGDQAMCLANDPNVILWAGMSPELIEAVNGLRTSGTIRMNPSSRFVYMVDGGGLRFPIAKQKRKYKTEHWAPVEFSAVKN